MVLAELSLFPMDKGVHLSDHVAKAVGTIAQSGLNYQLTAMGTLIEGPWDKVLAVIDRCYRDLEKDSSRIYLVLKLDAKKDADDEMHEKVLHVKKKVSIDVHT